jgi:hypothetical protein
MDAVVGLRRLMLYRQRRRLMLNRLGVNQGHNLREGLVGVHLDLLSVNEQERCRPNQLK